MRTQDQLTQLIHSLTASEKKYFKQFITMWGSSKNYERLFDEMLKQENYDAEALSKKLKKSKKQIADDKNYLQDVLLKSLRNYDEEVTQENRLTNAYMEVQALNRRGMNSMALRLLDKIYPEIIELELHGLYFAAFFCRLELAYKEGLSATPGIVPRAEFDEQVAFLRELADYTELYHDIGPYVMRRSDPEKAAAFLKDPLLVKKVSAVNSHRSKAMFLAIQNALQTLIHGLGGKGLEYAEDLVSLYEKDGRLRSIQPQVLPYAYMRVALSGTFKESTKSLAALQKARDVLDKSGQLFHPNIKNKVEEMVLRQQMVILNGIENYAQCEMVARELLSVKFDDGQQGRLVIVYYLFAHSLAMTGKATEANTALHTIFTMSFEHRVDLLLNARILHLIIQIEFGNYGLLPSMIKSTRGWIKKNKLQESGTEHVLKWMLRLAKEPSSESRKEMFRKMMEDIRGDKVKGLNPTFSSSINLSYWIESKLSATRFVL
jgi:hypothetical protein